MNSLIARAAIAAAASTSLLVLAPLTANATEAVTPVVQMGQNPDPLAAFNACWPLAFIPLIGADVVAPICFV